MVHIRFATKILISFEAWAKLAQHCLVCTPLGIHFEPINAFSVNIIIIKLCQIRSSLGQWCTIWAHQKQIRYNSWYCLCAYSVLISLCAFFFYNKMLFLLSRLLVTQEIIATSTSLCIQQAHDITPDILQH